MSPHERRAQAVRARMKLRAWEFRQLAGAKGTWFRLRRLLAGAREAFAVDGATIDELRDEGWKLEPVGDELEPRRRYVVVSAERAARVTRRRPLAVQLSAELLAAPDVIFVPFARESGEWTRANG